MGRKELYPVKKLVGFDQGMLDRIDQWRAGQRPIPNPSDAIRTLIDTALLSAGIGPDHDPKS